MFCPYCGRQNQEDVVFCEFCGKVLPQKGLQPGVAQYIAESNPSPNRDSAPRARVSFTTIKAVVTVLLIVGLVLVVLQIYYPGVFPWNWQTT
jgi:uncharacterized membrane protein YvbJ